MSVAEDVSVPWGVAAATGFQGAAIATGAYCAAVGTGLRSKAKAEGFCAAAIATGYKSSASAEAQAVALATGGDGHAHADQPNTIAIATGPGGVVSGSFEGCALVAFERDPFGDILSGALGYVGRDGIREGIQYRCVGGKLLEAEDDD